MCARKYSFFPLILSCSLSGINLGFLSWGNLYGSYFLGGGEKLDFFTPWGESCTVSWEGLEPNCSYISSLEQL